MKDKIGDKVRLTHILEAITDIEKFTLGIAYESYKENYMLRLALVRLLEIIGEASHHLSNDLKGEFTEIQWISLKSLRNVLAHEYFGVDYEIIWNLIIKNIPELKIRVTEILSNKFSV